MVLFIQKIIINATISIFDIVNFPFLDENVPRATSSGVCISQLIWFAIVSSHVTDFNTRNKILTAKFLKQVIGITKSVKLFLSSIDATMTWYQNLIRDSNLFLNKACRNLNFMVT